MNWWKMRVMIAAAVVVLATVSAAKADVFNMGGTRNPDGSWTGLASLETVPVGNPGNVGQLSGAGAGGYGPDRICGAVDYAYNIGKYEVTAGQYTAFLNAVAATDTYGLYNVTVWSSTYGCKIEQIGLPGSYTYSVAPEYANRPVNYISFWNACRFANWLHNGQPAGAEGPGTTETGAYALTTDGMNNNTITRNPNWKWAVTTEDEWYKSAYHKNDGNTGNYWRYPTQSDMTPGRDLVDLTGNNANYSGPIPIDSDTYYYTVVGEFQNSASPYGTFDQGGNVWEWTETTIYNGREERGGAAGYIDVGAAVMDASYRASWDWPWWPNHGGMGFRVVNVPEPSTLVLLALGGLGLLGWAWRKK